MLLGSVLGICAIITIMNGWWIVAVILNVWCLYWLYKILIQPLINDKNNKHDEECARCGGCYADVGPIVEKTNNLCHNCMVEIHKEINDNY